MRETAARCRWVARGLRGSADRSDSRSTTPQDCYRFNSWLRTADVRCSPIRLESYSAHTTSPLHAVASTTMPKAMRYQAKGTKLWVEM